MCHRLGFLAQPFAQLPLALFVARIRIPSNQFKVKDKWINLSPGMEVTAEIKTGTQKVWQYFLSPLIETGQSSLRER